MIQAIGIVMRAYKFGPAWTGLWTESTEALWWPNEQELWNLQW